jgi:PhnB protein
MRLNPYLSFPGTCAAAFKFYETCLGGKIVAMITYADTPMAGQLSAEARGRIAHARLTVGDQVLMGGDPPAEHYQAPKGFNVTLNIDDPAEAERVFHALAEGGTVTMPIDKTFWALRFGMLTDRFGTPWMINCEAPH